MKRVIAMLLAAVLTLSMLVCTGCDKKEKTDGVSPSDTVEEAPEFVQLDEHKFDEFLQEVDIAAVGDNLVKNSSFSEDSMPWSLYTESGGSASLSKEDEQCVINIANGGAVSHAVQIYYDGFKLHQFAKYEFSFVASSSINKVLEARIQLNGGDYRAYAIQFIDLTPEPQTYTIPFTMNFETDTAPRMAFNMGRALTGSEADLDLTDYTITLDDISLVCTDDSQVEDEDSGETAVPDVIVNQIGYAPDDEKIAIFRGFKYVDTFEVVDASGSVVYTGSTTEPEADNNTWEFTWYGDFSSVTAPGVYTVRSGVLGGSYPFRIGEGIYDNAFNDVVHMFYMQRCGSELTSEYAGDFAHAVCHGDNAVVYGTNRKLDVSGGWHDAGDYGRYVVPGAKAAADLMLAYEAAPEAFGDDANIPESGNGVPDILDEVRYELEWMLKMQDKDGSVFHKVTCADFPGMVMPEEETEQLIICPPSEMATGDFAAVMAKASYVYSGIDDAFAAKCLKAAEAAWKRLMVYEKTGEYSKKGNPEGILTGEYLDHRVNEEVEWAAAEMFRATGNSEYEAVLDRYMFISSYTGFGWANVGGYGLQTYLATDEAICDPEVRATMLKIFTDAADAIIKDAKKDSYGISLGSTYPWGSNMTVANNAMHLLMANDYAPNADYVKYAKKHLDYIFGANPVAVSFVTGTGTVSPESTHHRPSQALEETMPGMLVGGTNSNLEDPYAKSVLVNVAPEKCYVDNFNSYSINEITIYWNSPLVYVMTRLCEAE